LTQQFFNTGILHANLQISHGRGNRTHKPKHRSPMAYYWVIRKCMNLALWTCRRDKWYQNNISINSGNTWWATGKLRMDQGSSSQATTSCQRISEVYNITLLWIGINEFSGWRQFIYW